MAQALRKLVAAVEGVGHKIVAIGAIARFVRGCQGKVSSLEVLVSSGPDQREAVFSAARGEGLQQSKDSPLRLQFTDAKAGVTATVDLVEASTPLHARVIDRSERNDVLSNDMQVATAEDLILLGAEPSDMVQILRRNAARIDGPYLKAEAEAAGILDQVKQAWQEARKPE